MTMLMSRSERTEELSLSPPSGRQQTSNFVQTFAILQMGAKHITVLARETLRRVNGYTRGFEGEQTLCSPASGLWKETILLAHDRVVGISCFTALGLGAVGKKGKRLFDLWLPSSNTGLY